MPTRRPPHTPRTLALSPYGVSTYSGPPLAPLVPRRASLELSRVLADLVPPEPKACYRNALLCLPFSQTYGAQYCEGIALLPSGLPIEHGWLEMPDEQVADPTWRVVYKDAEFARCLYIAACRIDGVAAMAMALRRGATLPLAAAPGHAYWDRLTPLLSALGGYQ